MKAKNKAKAEMNENIHSEAEKTAMERALHESRERTRLILDSLAAGILIVDAETHTIVDINPAATKMIGAPREQIVGHTCHKFVCPKDVGECPITDLGQSIDSSERTLLTATGQELPVLKTVTTIPLDGRKHLLESFIDLSERKQAGIALQERTRALRAEKEKAHQYLNIAGVAIVALDSDGCITLINKRGLELLGYEEAELSGKNWFETCLPERLREQVYAVFQQLMTGQIDPVEYYENPALTKSGEERTFAWHNSLLRNAAGDIVGTLSSGEDITERKQVEKEREQLLTQIQEQVRRVQQIIDTVPEGVLLLSADGQVVLTNPVAEKDLSILANAQVGDTITHLGDRPLAELLTSPPKGLWHEVQVDDRTFEVTARPMRNGPKPEDWVLVINDVTQEREIQQRAQQQERLAAVGQLAAGIAHDFNNIMAAIVLYAQTTAREHDLPATVRDRMTTVNQQAMHATHLIRQILDFSRHSVLERRPFDLLPFLKEQTQLLKRTLPENITVKLTYETDEHTTMFLVNADPTHIQQIITNLAINARDAMPEGGELLVKLAQIHIASRKEAPLPEMKAGEWIQVAVSDTGTGIPPDVLPHIFEPFFTTKAPQGSGLGLAQVHGIVGSHEGHIAVDTQLGEGTTFTIYLPTLPLESPEPSTLEMGSLAKGQGETILVVEDNAAALEALVESLQQLNYRTMEATNGREALAILKQHGDKIALVLSDVVMPKMGGIALLQNLRRQGATVPVVMLTGHPMKKELDLQAQNLSGWMLKPPTVGQLAQVVARVLRQGTDQ